MLIHELKQRYPRIAAIFLGTAPSELLPAQEAEQMRTLFKGEDSLL